MITATKEVAPPAKRHSHVFVQVISSVDGAALDSITPSNLDGFKLLNYTDSASLGGVQTISMSIPGRARRENGTARPTDEVLSVGDLIRSSGFAWTGEAGSGRVYGLCDAIVTDVQASESLQDGEFQYTTMVSAQSLQHVLSTDSVAWWMYYGTEIGALRTKGSMMPDDVSGHLDKTISNYLNTVALNYNNWARDNVGLKERLGLDLRGLAGNTPVAKNMLVAEGSHWGIISEQVDQPLHELFMQMRSPNDPDRPARGNIKQAPTYKPKGISGTEGASEDDGAAPFIVLRPAPFPYADENGQGQTDEWEALPLHDFTHPRHVMGQSGFAGSIQNVRNFFMVFPQVDFMDERMAFTAGLAVSNPESIRRYSYRPIKFRTKLILKDGDQQGFMTMAKRLTWRIAGQMNRMDKMRNGQITVPFSPAVQCGDRVRFRFRNSDMTAASVFEGYVTARSHTWSPNGGQTSITLERVLPASTYQDPAWFVAGLSSLVVNMDTPATGDNKWKPAPV